MMSTDAAARVEVVNDLPLPLARDEYTKTRHVSVYSFPPVLSTASMSGNTCTLPLVEFNEP